MIRSKELDEAKFIYHLSHRLCQMNLETIMILSLLIAKECMVPLCSSCDISGKETRFGNGLTLEECKSGCLNNITCLGIDFGRYERVGECFFNEEQNVNFEAHESFDGWSKSTNCGNYNRYYEFVIMLND